MHSLAVVPEWQNEGIGKTIMKAYLQRMEGAGIADRVALLARPELVGYYTRLGFVRKGTSKCEFGGGVWVDMVCWLGFFVFSWEYGSMANRNSFFK